MKKRLAKAIGIRFPPDHPVWDVPERQRPEWVRALVDMALLNQYKLLNEAVARIEARLDALVDVLEAGHISEQQQPESPPAVKIDPAAFFDI